MAGNRGKMAHIPKVCAIALCSYVTWAAWRGPPPRSFPPPPSPLTREPSEQEANLVNEIAKRLSLAVLQTRQRLDRPLAINELEGQDASGQPHLPYPIPDNPLVSGVSTTAVWCGDAQRPYDVDWLYCPETSTFTPGGAQ